MRYGSGEYRYEDLKVQVRTDTSTIEIIFYINDMKSFILTLQAENYKDFDEYENWERLKVHIECPEAFKAIAENSAVHSWISQVSNKMKRTLTTAREVMRINKVIFKKKYDDEMAQVEAYIQQMIKDCNTYFLVNELSAIARLELEKAGYWIAETDNGEFKVSV